MLELLGRRIGLGWLFTFLAFITFRRGNLPKKQFETDCPYYGKCKGITCAYLVAIPRDNTVVNAPKWASRQRLRIFFQTRVDCSSGRDGR